MILCSRKSFNFSCTKGCIAMGHFHGAWTIGFVSSQRVMWYVPGKHPIPSNLSGCDLMRSLVLSCFRLVRSFCTCWHPVVGFCCVSFFQQKCTAQLYSTIPSFEHDGRPKIVGPGVSAMYHWVCSQLATFFPSGFQSIAVSNMPHCLMVDPL